MALLDLLTCSRQADELCLVYCKSHANVILCCSDAVLINLISKSGKQHIVWMDPSASKNGFDSYVRAFYEFNEDIDDDLSNAVSKHIIVADKDIFCYNGNAYFLYTTPNGNLSIRRLKVLPTQDVVETLFRCTEDRPCTPCSVFLSKFSLIENNTLRYATVCWGATYEGKICYTSVFDKDDHWLQEYLISAFVKEELPVGSIFEKDGSYYKLVTDDNGKLCLERSSSVFTFNKPELTVKEHLKARFIPMYSKSGGT